MPLASIPLALIFLVIIPLAVEPERPSQNPRIHPFDPVQLSDKILPEDLLRRTRF